MRRKNELILLLLLFLLTMGVRMALISKGPYHYDSLELLITAQKTLDTHQLQYMHGAGYPFTVLIGAIFLLVFGHSLPVFAVNLIGVVFGSASVLALYYLVRRLLSVEAAFFSAALFSFLPGLLSVSIYGSNNPVSLFFILLSASFIAKSVSGKGRINLAWSGVCLGAAAGSRLPDAVVLLPLALFYFSSAAINRRSLKNFFLDFLIPFAAVLALCYYPMFARGELGGLFAIPEEMGGKYLGPFSRLLGYSNTAFIDLVSPPLFISALGGLIFLVRENRRKLFYFFLAWFCVTFFFYANISSMEPRMLLIAAVPAAALAGFFLARFSRKMPVAACLLLAAMCAVMFFSIYPTLEFRHGNNLQKQFAQWVRKNTPADAVLISNDEWLFLTYYAQRQPLHKPWGCDGFTLGAFEKAIDRELGAGRRVFVLESVLATDHCGFFSKRQGQKYSLTVAGQCDNEDWHHDCLRMHIYNEELLELKKK